MNIVPTPAGDMRYRLTVIETTPGQKNERGETQPVDAALRKIWAKVTPISGTEKFVNAQVNMQVTHEIRCRYVPYINNTCKLQMGQRIFDLSSVLDIESQNIELLILAIETR